MSTTHSVKIICLNIWIGGILFEKIVEFLQKEDPDIVLLQEVYRAEDFSLKKQYRSLVALQEVLQYPYEHFAPAFIETIEEAGGIKIPQGNAILSRFPLTAQETVFYDFPFGDRDNRREAFYRTPRNLQHVVAQVAPNMPVFHLFNTQGIWGEDGGDSPRRLEMAAKIIAEVQKVRKSEPNAQIIVAGDFNLQPSTQTVRNIEEHLVNVFRLEYGTSVNTTFNLKRKDLVKFPGYATALVDMFFVSPNVKVLRHSMPAVDVSDHYPLVVELEL